jgi:hypothetical protein
MKVDTILRAVRQIVGLVRRQRCGICKLDLSPGIPRMPGHCWRVAELVWSGNCHINLRRTFLFPVERYADRLLALPHKRILRQK